MYYWWIRGFVFLMSRTGYETNDKFHGNKSGFKIREKMWWIRYRSHRAQVKRFTSDLLKVLKTQPSKQIALYDLPTMFEKSTHKTFKISDYGVSFKYWFFFTFYFSISELKLRLII